MTSVQNVFGGQEVTFVVDNDIDVVFVQREFRMPAVKLDDIKNMNIMPTDVTQNLLVIAESEDDGLERLTDLMAQGCDAADLRFVDIGAGQTLARTHPQQLLARLARPKDVYWRTTRSLAEWGESVPLQSFETHVEQFTARWAFPDVAVFCGGYGSGKSTIAQMFALKLAHHNGWPIHICAWEDRRDDLQSRLWRTAIGHTHREDLTGIDVRPAMSLEKIVFWDEPDTLDERSLVNYFERIRYLHRARGVKVFVCDPWNEFDHDNSPGERETIYIRRMMREAQRMARELGIIFMIVTHLPKSGYSDDGNVKPFRIANAAGSAEFGNKASHGFCVARTQLLADMLNSESGEMDQGDRDRAMKIISAFGPAKGREHVLISIDKVKIEPEMGRRGVLAYVLDKQKNDLIFDPAATEVAKIVWRA